MDVNALTLLVEILDAGNLSEAARRLKMTRANVSYHLNSLERSIGQQLVRRTTRRVEATEIGLRLYEHGQTIRNEMMAAQESIASLGQSLQGRVRLSVPSGYGQLVMSQWLLEFKRLYPGIVLDVVFENRVEDLIRDEVDIAVRVMSEPPQHLVARDLGAMHYVVCASRAWAEAHGMPADLDALSNVPLIASAVVSRQLRVTAYQGIERHEVIVEPTLISENYLFLRQAVLAGLGIGMVPDYVVQQDVERGDVVTALHDWRLSIFGTRMYMLYMPNRHHTRAASTFIEFMLERAHQAGRREEAGRSTERNDKVDEPQQPDQS
ncbi:LysR substrate-binding domain-containing protein [Piscinibacter sp.]|jgi:DNA-binding transcriptional LysR family regulator|uniref:LysR family transcriptional regulator n=1 Tax=Piscinibacter sp. TaxID=1903157 RepID=UPI0035B11393